MLKKLDELKSYPFVVDILRGKITKAKLKLFVSNLNEFLKDKDFRNKFGFDKTDYTIKEGVALIRYLIKGKMGIEDLLVGAEVFAYYVTEKWPQINEAGEINYYFAGSLAVMLLAQTDSMTLLDPQYFPKISPLQIINMPTQVKARLTTFARKIGDLDYIKSPNYDKYQKRLKKGGGGPSIKELPKLARSILEIKEGHVMVMCDPVESYLPHKVVEIKVVNRVYFIAEPKLIFGYKILNILQSFDKKPAKFIRDFEILLEALLMIYPEQDLVKTTYEVLAGFEYKMHEIDRLFDKPPEARVREYVRVVYNSQNVVPGLRLFLDKIVAYDRTHNTIL